MQSSDGAGSRAEVFEPGAVILRDHRRKQILSLGVALLWQGIWDIFELAKDKGHCVQDMGCSSTSTLNHGDGAG